MKTYRPYTVLGYAANYTQGKNLSHIISKENLWERKSPEMKMTTKSLINKKGESLSIWSDHTVQIGLWSTLFLCRIKLQLHVWLKQEQKDNNELGHTNITLIHTWSKIALHFESLRGWLLPQSIHLEYPAELDQTAHVYSLQHTHTHHTCMLTQKRWENIFLLIHCAQTTESIYPE